jgi:prevent-host-death family protein
VSKVVNVHDAKTHLSRLLEEVRAGKEIILAKGGKPYAKLSPIDALRRPLGFVPGRLTEDFFASLPEEELKGWE